MNWKKWSVIICIIAVILFIGVLFISNNLSRDISLPISDVSVDDVITPEKMKKDLDYIVTTLREVHPKTYSGFTPEQEDIIENAYKKIEEPMRLKDFYFIANEILCSMKDAHTSMRSLNGMNLKTINLNIIWLNDGMYVGNYVGTLKKGDRILSIGGKNEEAILADLSRLIPAENQQWLKVMGSDYLTVDMYLEHLGLIEDNKVNLLVERNGLEITESLSFTEHANKMNYSSDNWVSYTIDNENSLGIFTLNQCIYDNKYKSTLKDFFQEVRENDIRHVAVDIRNNPGGNSKVVDEFIRYLDVSKYDSYGADIRYSEQVKEQRGERNKGKQYVSNIARVNENDRVNDKLLFKGDVYILTSPVTFSSGNWFAVIFKDNKLGTIIGEPTGNQPSSYGDILSFQTPEAKFNFSISYKRFTRPDTDKNSEESLFPDVYVYTQIEDILNNHDPQVEKLKEIINK